jgi:hypothetical protein
MLQPQAVGLPGSACLPQALRGWVRIVIAIKQCFGRPLVLGPGLVEPSSMGSQFLLGEGHDQLLVVVRSMPLEPKIQLTQLHQGLVWYTCTACAIS